MSFIISAVSKNISFINNGTRIHFILFLVLSLSILFIFWFDINLLFSTLLFFGVPSILLSILAIPSIKNALIFAFLTAIPMSLIIDYTGTVNEQWTIIASSFSYRILGVVSIEMILWGFLCIYSIAIYYARFVNPLLNMQMLRIVIPFSFLSIVFLILINLYPAAFKMDYAYLTMGVVFIILPILYWLLTNKIESKLLRVIPYFFVLGLGFVLTSILNELWIYPGSYLFKINFLDFSFPIEELIFWNLALPLCVSTIIQKTSQVP